MIISRSLSPAARSLFRDVTPKRRSVAAEPDFTCSRRPLRGVPVPLSDIEAESNAREEGSEERLTSSFWRWRMRRKIEGGRYSIAWSQRCLFSMPLLALGR